MQLSFTQILAPFVRSVYPKNDEHGGEREQQEESHVLSPFSIAHDTRP